VAPNVAILRHLAVLRVDLDISVPPPGFTRIIFFSKVRMMPKYIVVPGHVSSRHDSQHHYIDAPTLMRLYKVDPKECIVRYRDHRDAAYDFDALDLIELRPRYDGNYEVPK
jgi:hypothetical protein